MITASISLSRSGGFHLAADLEFSRGVTALFGPSGAGKSTVLQVLAGLLRPDTPDKVHVTCDGTTWQDNTTFVPAHERRVGYVFQQPQLFPHLSVRGNLDYATRRAKAAPVSRDDIHGWLDLEPLMDRAVTGLSGGQAQRVALARALLAGPRCLLMDEPMGSLDTAARRRILPYLDRVCRELDIPVVYVTHAMDEVQYLADQVVLIDAGEIQHVGSVFETSSNPHIAAVADPRPGSVVSCTVRGYDERWALAELSLADATIQVACDPIAAGDHIRLRIAAADISLTLDPPSRTSILNIIPARIEAISEDASRHHVLIKLAIGSEHLLAAITRKSSADLALEVGTAVFAQIKGAALLTETRSQRSDGDE